MTLEILFTTWDGGGSVPPTMGAIRRLRARGHNVRLLGDPVLRDEATAAGAEFVAWRRAPGRTERSVATDYLRDWEAEGIGGDLRRLCERIMFGPAARYAADTAEELARRPTDLVVCSDLLFGPMAAAEAAGVKLAVLGPNISLAPLPGMPPVGPGMPPPVTPEEHAMAQGARDFLEGILAGQLPAMNAARALLGLPPVAHVFDQLAVADRVILATSRAFDFPADPMPDRVRYVGPLMDQPDWTADWASPWSKDDQRPLLLLAFSTTFQGQADSIQAVLDAVAALPVRMLITLGPYLSDASFRVPDNAALVVSAPHDAVMREASLVVTHAGHGTVMRALAHGLPMLCLPMGRDQNDNAARVVARGAGLRLPRDADAATIRAALRRTLDEPTFRTAAASLGAAIAGAEPPGALVEELEAIMPRQERRIAA